MNDGLGTPPRLNWNPTTDSGGEAPPKRPSEPAFSFNLGQALAKLGLDPDGPIDARPAPADHEPLDALADLQRKLGTAVAAAPAAHAAPEAPVAPVAPAAPAAHAVTPVLEDASTPLARRVPKSTPVPIDDGPAVVAPRPLRPEIDEPLPTRRPVQPVAEAPLPTRAPAPQPVAESPLPTRQPAPVAQPVAETPLPTRQHTPAAPVAQPAQPVQAEPAVAAAPAVERAMPEITNAQAAPRRSVFDDVVAVTPTLPPTVTGNAVPTARTAAVPAEQPTLPPSGQQAPAQPVATAAPAPVLPAGLTAMPTLPPAAPKATPIVAPVVDAVPQQADIRALRSAQLRVQRQQRRRHPVLRSMGILLILGAIGAAALYFGRPFLFPTEWDPALTAVVDDIEVERGRQFDHTVGLVQQTTADFEATVMRLTLGQEWPARAAEWRALGLGGGEISTTSVAGTVRAGRTAIYDPTSDRIYIPDDVTAADAGTDLRLALEQAFDAQLGVTPVAPPATGLTGISPASVIAQRAVDAFLVDGTDRDLLTWQPTAGVPAPIEYELLAGDVLGAALLDAAGIDPATATFDLPATVVELGTALDDRPEAAVPGALQVGERKLADPVAIGLDDWSLVWAQRLPVTTAQQLGSLVVGDTYQPIDRNGVTCVVGTFASPTPGEADIVLVEMTNWVAAAPIESQATATRLDDVTVQLVTCDPGTAVTITPNPEAVRLVLERQLARLAAV